MSFLEKNQLWVFKKVHAHCKKQFVIELFFACHEMKSESESHLVVSDSLWPHGLQPARLLCLWNYPGKNTGVGSHSLLQGDLPNPGIEPRSPALQVNSFSSEPPGKPKNTGVGSLSLLQGSSWAKNQTGVSCIAEGFPTRLSIREALTIVKFTCQSGRLGNLYKNYKHFCISSSPQNKKSVANLIDVGMGGRFSYREKLREMSPLCCCTI